MGFMDKAKKLAEQGKVLADQAQVKLDEAQKQFNDNQARPPSNPSAAGSGIEYDEHGRKVAQPADAAHTTATPQQGDPFAESAPPSPPADKSPHIEATDPDPPHGDPLRDAGPKPPQPPSGDAGLTSGDPLAG